MEARAAGTNVERPGSALVIAFGAGAIVALGMLALLMLAGFRAM